MVRVASMWMIAGQALHQHCCCSLSAQQVQHASWQWLQSRGTKS